MPEKSRIASKFSRNSFFQRSHINNLRTQRFKTLSLTYSLFINNSTKWYCFKHDITILECMNKQLQILIKILKEIKGDTYKETVSWMTKKKFPNLLISFPLLVFYFFYLLSFSFSLMKEIIVLNVLDASQHPKPLFKRGHACHRNKAIGLHEPAMHSTLDYKL